MCEGKMGYTKAALSQWNKKTVINIIRTQGPINKAEIARQAELSIPTVMKITDEFERRHLIRNELEKESLQVEKDLICLNLCQMHIIL